MGMMGITAPHDAGYRAMSDAFELNKWMGRMVVVVMVMTV
jgi:hypothetical protein